MARLNAMRTCECVACETICAENCAIPKGIKWCVGGLTEAPESHYYVKFWVIIGAVFGGSGSNWVDFGYTLYPPC